MSTSDIDKIKMLNNPFVKGVAYCLLFMGIGIAGVWILLGIISPILLVLLILHWN